MERSLLGCMNASPESRYCAFPEQGSSTTICEYCGARLPRTAGMCAVCGSDVYWQRPAPPQPQAAILAQAQQAEAIPRNSVANVQPTDSVQSTDCVQPNDSVQPTDCVQKNVEQAPKRAGEALLRVTPGKLPTFAALGLGNYKGILHSKRKPEQEKVPVTPQEKLSKGVALYESGCFTEALPLLREAGQHGYSSAQFYIGLMYDKGVGLERDYVKSLVWYLRAAKQGYAPAQFRVGVLYEKGRGTVVDNELAFYWYLKAAQQGLAPAQKSVANCYNYGYGVEQNTTEAEKWYLMAQGRNSLGNFEF